MTEGIGVAKLSADMLKALWAAEQAGGAAAVSAEVAAIAGQLGTNTQAVWNGVIAAQGAGSSAVQGMARAVVRAVAAVTPQGTTAQAVLGLSGAPVATTATSTAAPGLVARAGAAVAKWWAGAGIATQVVVVAGVIVVVVGGVSWVAGVWSDDPDTAATAVQIPADDGDRDGVQPSAATPDFGGDGATFGGDVTLAAGTEFTQPGQRIETDGTFTLELIDDGQPVDGDFELSGTVGVETVDDLSNVVCSLEFLVGVRIRGGTTSYEFTFGRVFGPGHLDMGCDRADYVEVDEASGRATIEFTELTDERIAGFVVIENQQFLEFSGRRRD